MADSDDKPSRARRNTSGAGSGGTAISRPASLTRTVTGNYLDDQSQYHGHSYHDSHHDNAIDHDEDSETDLSEKETQDTEDDIQQESGEDIVPEVRDGIEDERDVEAGPKLEKSKTSKSRRSVRDPNLVTWDGPDDKTNPKNWRWQQKWAATLVGKCQSAALLEEIIDN